MKMTVTTNELPDGRVRASCPSLPGCVSYGTSADEAMQSLEHLIASYLLAFDSAALCSEKKQPLELCMV